MANPGQKEIVLTRAGLEKLEKELNYLKTVRRREVATRIREAAELGDLSENSEYDEAKNEQAFLEGRIARLEGMLRRARVLDDQSEGGTTVVIGSKVVLRDQETGEELEYTIVSSAEAAPEDNLISDESPVGKALMGKQPGAVVQVEVPAGTLTYEILEVTN